VSFSDFTSTPVGLLLPGTCSAQICRPHDARDHERQQVMQREEAVQRRVVDRETRPHSQLVIEGPMTGSGAETGW